MQVGCKLHMFNKNVSLQYMQYHQQVWLVLCDKECPARSSMPWRFQPNQPEQP
jgi:hypothetical protein